MNILSWQRKARWIEKQPSGKKEVYIFLVRKEEGKEKI